MGRPRREGGVTAVAAGRLLLAAGVLATVGQAFLHPSPLPIMGAARRSHQATAMRMMAESAEVRACVRACVRVEARQ